MPCGPSQARHSSSGSGGSPAPSPTDGLHPISGAVSPVVSVISFSEVGTTYQLVLRLGDRAENIYTIYGEAGHPLKMPPAYQVSRRCRLMFSLRAAQLLDSPAAHWVKSSLLACDSLQVPTPFGVDVGGVPPAFIDVSPASQYDSWLTVGVTDGSKASLVSSIGFDFDAWTSTNGISNSNCAVFWMYALELHTHLPINSTLYLSSTLVITECEF